MSPSRRACFDAGARSLRCDWPQARRRKAGGAREASASVAPSAEPTWEVPLKADLASAARAQAEEKTPEVWKPGQSPPVPPGTGTACASRPPRSVDTLRRKAQALLNKLSARNEAAVVSQLLYMEPSTCEEVDMIADLVYDQVLKDTPNAKLYCRAAIAMNEAFPSFLVTEGASKDVSGCPRRLPSTLPRRSRSLAGRMLQRCQMDFDRCRNLPDALAGSGSPAQGSASQSCAGGWSKDQSFACLHLLGHLCLCGVASPRILSQVLVELLRSDPRKQERCECPRESTETVAALPHELHVECACELLHVVAVSDKDQQAWSLVWSRLAWLKDARGHGHLGEAAPVYSPRLRFLILDVLEASQRRAAARKMQ